MHLSRKDGGGGGGGWRYLAKKQEVEGRCHSISSSSIEEMMRWLMMTET